LVVAKPASLDLCESEDIFRLPTPVKPGELIGSINMLIQLDQKNTATRCQGGARRRRADPKGKELLMDRNGMTEPQPISFSSAKA
jgi:response regulator NasT